MKIKKHTITHAIKYIFLSLLLALPFIAMLPSTFYYAFNQNAQDNTANEVNINYQFQTNEVNTINDLIEDNIYKVNISSITNITENQNNIKITTIDNEENETTFYLKITNTEGITLKTYNNYFELFNTNNDFYLYGDTNDTTNNRFYMPIVLENTSPIESNTADIRIYANTFNDCYFDNVYIINYKNNLKKIIESIDNQTQIENQQPSSENFLQFIHKSDFLGTKNVEIIEHDLNNQNAFYYASSQVFEKPLFNWVKNSIFVVPIMGMLGIFGISEMNFISSLLVYWVNILSIYAILNIILLVIEKLGSFGKRKNE